MGHEVAVDLGRRRLRQVVSISAFRKRAKQAFLARRTSRPHAPVAGSENQTITISPAELEAARNNPAGEDFLRFALDQEQQLERNGLIHP